MTPFKLGIVVLAHRDPDQVGRLLALLRHERVTVYLHIDRASDVEQFRASLAAVRAPEIVWVRRFRTAWGRLGMVDAILAAAAQAVGDGCAQVMVISGHDLPLKPIDEIVAFAAVAGSASYIETFPFPVEHWLLGGTYRTEMYTFPVPFFGGIYTAFPRDQTTYRVGRKQMPVVFALRTLAALMPERRFPSYLQPYGGWMWWNLSSDAIEYVLRFTQEHPDYRRYHRFTQIPDEVFVQSIMAGSGYTGIVHNDDLRFVRWRRGSPHPEPLTVEDVPEMIASGDLFARKFSPEQAPSVIEALRG
ncbi:MAG TPA: beta-1,6-N-acetylglucosaminyltransferase [Solirubrobacteraceae bacterium]|jgi:hypothetical protein|nr:beta-1,6-N-acetylglucosaminyltransferase [Solirubrobacteraceae bacterium]